MAADFKITTAQEKQFFAQPLTDEDPPRNARVDTSVRVPQWELRPSAATDAQLIPADDGMSATLVPGLLGTDENGVPIAFTCDADLGAGVREVTRIFFVQIVEIEAVKVAITEGPAVPKRTA